MAKKERMPEPELPEVKEVEEEIPVEETVVAEPEPEPEPEPKLKPKAAPEVNKDGAVFVGMARGKKLFKDEEGNTFFED
jgi:hypothetical protein